jgi:iron complex outermembrane receptor protein
VPGYLKLNKYRVWGDVLKVTKKTDSGLLRAGFWFEGSDTRRHNLEADLSTDTVLPGAKAGFPNGVVTSSNFATQYSSWHQIQPFAEYEWTPLPSLTVTPGYKLMSYNIGLHSILNQKALTPQAYDYHYSASLPFLTVNKRLGDEDSLYSQYAKGMEVPFANVGLSSSSRPAPQTTTNYQFGGVHKSDRLTLDGDVYYITMNNMQLNTGTNANPAYTNVGGARYRGFEGEATYALVSGWALYGNVGRNSATYNSGNASSGQPTGEIPNAPRITTGAGVLYNQGAWNASLLYKHIGEQLNIKLGGQLEPINNVDLNVAYTFTALSSWGVKGLRVQGSVFNLTNSRKITSVTGPLSSASTQYQWQAPRSFMVSLKADL